MSSRRFAAASCLVAAWMACACLSRSDAGEAPKAPAIQKGDKVRAINGPAPIKASGSDKTLITVETGTVLEALEVNGDWVKVKATTEGGAYTGWVKASRHLVGVPLPIAEHGEPAAETTKSTEEPKERGTKGREAGEARERADPPTPSEGLAPSVVAKVEEAKKVLIGKKEGTFNEGLFKASLDAVTKSNAIEAATRIPGMREFTKLQILQLELQAAPFFFSGDTVYPYRSTTPRNHPRTFESAVRAITAHKISQAQRVAQLGGGSDSENRGKAVFLLLSSAGLFVTKLRTFNAGAFSAAIENLSEQKVEKVQNFFTDRVEAYFCLLRAAGRFVAQDGSLDKDRYNAALAQVTAEQVTMVKEKTGLPEASSAVDVILMNASVGGRRD